MYRLQVRVLSESQKIKKTIMNNKKKCPKCHGKGHVGSPVKILIGDPCNECNGTGYVDDLEADEIERQNQIQENPSTRHMPPPFGPL
jgi:DnaJ-class molecular chaperone